MVLQNGQHMEANLSCNGCTLSMLSIRNCTVARFFTRCARPNQMRLILHLHGCNVGWVFGILFQSGFKHCFPTETSLDSNTLSATLVVNLGENLLTWVSNSSKLISISPIFSLHTQNLTHTHSYKGV